ncbi:hypothetical protein [Streptosporangium sp. NPDC051022]|uniref:hypothetical protein n=1 Tax=Streptosporangium sp. NPDC051022 TaxID=3155752 RepID=UPI0034372FDB
MLYSLGERRFYAIATWPTPEPLMVAADTVEELEERMRQAERDIAWRAFPTPPPPDRCDGIHSQVPAVAPQHLHPYRRAA